MVVNMKLIKIITGKLHRKPLLVKPAVVVTAGITCPRCNIDGLFKIERGYKCEECLSNFNENKLLVSD